MRSLRQILAPIRTRLQAEQVRIPIQTASAVLLAYFATSFMDTEDVSWGVFSALFVVQASIGGTIGAAVGRIAGAVLGAFIAVSLVMLNGSGGGSTLVSLLVGVALMSFLTAKWPVLAYGLVTVTVIAVAPGFQVVEGALRKVLAIAIGSTCGMVAAFAVLPVLARRTEQEYLASALRSCGDYLVECTTCLVTDKECKDRQSQDAILRAIERARVMAREARIEEKTPAMGFSPFSTTLLSEVERFAYTLTLVDRFSDVPMSESLCGLNKDQLLELAEAVKTTLDSIADAVEAGLSCEPTEDARAAYERFVLRADECLQHDELSMPDREHLVAIKSAYASVVSNLDELARQAQASRRAQSSLLSIDR